MGDGRGVHELAIKVDQLPVACDGGGVGACVAGEHEVKVAVDAARRRGEVHARVLERVDGTQGKRGRDVLVPLPEQGRVQV